MPNVKVDWETYRLLMRLKYEFFLKGEKVSLGDLVKSAVFEKYKSEKVEKYESEKVKKTEGEKMEKYESEKVEKHESEAVEVSEPRDLVEKYREAEVGLEVIREVRTGFCPYCGEIGTPVKALYTGNWIHRLLIRCECGKKYVSYLGESGIKKVEEFEKLKEKYPECELYPWEEFKKRFKISRSV